jgi:hypothetical protein
MNPARPPDIVHQLISTYNPFDDMTSIFIGNLLLLLYYMTFHLRQWRQPGGLFYPDIAAMRSGTPVERRGAELPSALLREGQMR